MAEMTQEQKQLTVTLAAEYGPKVYAQAVELSGLSLCLVSLGADVLTAAERERMYRQASLHLAKLLETVMSPEHSARVTECAKRMDAALDTWMLDAIEMRDGLPAIECVRAEGCRLRNGQCQQVGKCLHRVAPS